MGAATIIFFAGAFFGSTLDLVLLLIITFAAEGHKRRKDDESNEK